MLQILDLFNRAAAIGASITLHEQSVPGAEEALRAWAAERKLALDDREWTVADDHPMVDWRGMRVSVVAAGNICVHRATPRKAA